MAKDIKLYKQRGDTCAIVCMLMVLEYYEIISKINWYDERKYYRIYHSHYTKGTPFSAIAYHLAKNGLEVTIYHSDKNLFNNTKNIFDEYTFNNLLSEYKFFLNNAKKYNIKIINGININSLLLKNILDNKKLLIIALELQNSIFHAALLCGYNADYFEVCDPMYKEKQFKSMKEIDDLMNTSIGIWFIAV